jgi:hypothetical protein
MSRSGWWATGLIVGPMLLAFFTGSTVITEAQFRLATGWIAFLARTLPKVRIDPMAVAIGVICLACLAVGGHLFLSWLYSATGPQNTPYQTHAPRRWRIRWTAYIVTILVTAFAAGISGVGVLHQMAWIAAGPDPEASHRGK